MVKAWRLVVGPGKGRGFPRAKRWSWVKFEQKWSAQKGQRFKRLRKMMTWFEMQKHYNYLHPTCSMATVGDDSGIDRVQDTTDTKTARIRITLACD